MYFYFFLHCFFIGSTISIVFVWKLDCLLKIIFQPVSSGIFHEKHKFPRFEKNKFLRSWKIKTYSIKIASFHKRKIVYSLNSPGAKWLPESQSLQNFRIFIHSKPCFYSPCTHNQWFTLFVKISYLTDSTFFNLAWRTLLHPTKWKPFSKRQKQRMKAFYYKFF